MIRAAIAAWEAHMAAESGVRSRAVRPAEGSEDGVFRRGATIG
jgi:hypothetical protein